MITQLNTIDAVFGDALVYRNRIIDVEAVQRVLLSHPHVREAMIIGDPLASGEQIPVAFVTTREAHSCTGEELIEYVALRVPPSQRLRGIYFTVAGTKALPANAAIAAAEQFIETERKHYA